MTSTVPTLAHLLGDIDRSHYVWRDGRLLVRRAKHGHICWTPREGNQ